MIIEWIVTSILGLVQGALEAVLPTTAAPWDTYDVSGYLHFYTWFNSFLPLDEAIGVGITVFQVLGVLASIWAVTKVLQWTHALGGGA